MLRVATNTARAATRQARSPMRPFSADASPTAMYERLMRDNPALIEATLKTAEAMKLTGTESATVAELETLGNQYVNVKAATPFTDTAVSKTLRMGDVSALQKAPVRVAITGAAGAIGYSMAFRVAGGMMLGPNQPVILQLIELPGAMNALEGVVMELRDCAFPLVAGIETASSVEKGFEGVNYALLVGSKPRGPGMERGDLLRDNGKIFVGQGKALNQFASRDVKVVVVGNPANTNCLIAASNAPDLDPSQFTALTRLDHDRALAQIAEKVNCRVTDIAKLCIWGNHSATQFPDITYATVNGKKLPEMVDGKWVNNEFIPRVQKRGAEIIGARGASSAASAANGAISHIRDWVQGTAGGWTSMAVPSCKAYGVGEGVYYSYPVICENGTYTKVMDLPVSKAQKALMDATRKELFSERDAVKAMLPN